MAIGIAPGWFWYLYDLAIEPEVRAFTVKNQALMRVRKTFRGTMTQTEIMVFEVFRGPALLWTLPGYPEQAPKKFETSPGDIAAKTANPSPSLRATLEELVGKPYEAIKRTADNANTAVNILIFGGAAVLLWNLYQHTRTRDEAPT